MLYYLAANKAIQDRLRKEVNENIGENGRINLDVLNELEYMDQVFHGRKSKCSYERKQTNSKYQKLETLRINPPSGISTKLCTNATELKDYEDNPVAIEKGMVVQIPIYCIHHDDRYYSEPEKFNPDRFSSANGGLKAYKDKGVFLGFLDGPRMCLGIN